MFRLFSTPVWFNGIDIIFDLMGLVVALLIAGYSWRMFRVSKENKYAYFSLAFILIMFSLLAKSITSSVLYFTPIRDAAAVTLGPIAGTKLSLSALYYRLGFFLQMVSMLGGWLLIFFISQKSRSRLRKYYELSQIGLFLYLVLLISIVSNFQYFVFYLTSTVLLSLIVLNYYKNYLNVDKNNNALLVMSSFFLMLLGNIFFVFVFLVKELYVIGQVLMVLGFILLLYTYRKVVRS